MRALPPDVSHAAGHDAARGVAHDVAPLPRWIAVGDLAVASPDALAAALDGASAVVHLAGRAHVMQQEPDADAAYAAANVEATRRLAVAAVGAGVGRFVIVSSVKVHGESTAPGCPLSAGSAFSPQDAYARSKVAAEAALAAVCAGTPMVPVILRTPLMYGPGVKGNFLALLEAVARRAWLPLGAIDNRRDLLFVGNLAHAIAALLDADEPVAGAWMVADGRAVSTPELVRRIASALDVAPRLLRVPLPMLELAARVSGRRAQMQRLAQSFEVDATPLARRIGPLRYSLDDGLAMTARWWRGRHGI